jgi:hypothetical protein
MARWAVAILIGLALNFVKIDPIRALERAANLCSKSSTSPGARPPENLQFAAVHSDRPYSRAPIPGVASTRTALEFGGTGARRPEDSHGRRPAIWR